MKQTIAVDVVVRLTVDVENMTVSARQIKDAKAVHVQNAVEAEEIALEWIEKKLPKPAPPQWKQPSLID